MFYISADDGIRFYINDLLIVDSWIGTRVLERTTSANLVRFNFYSYFILISLYLLSSPSYSL